MKKMSKKEEILDLIAKKAYPSDKIALKLNLKLDLVWTYLSDLTKTGRIEIVNNKKPYEYRAKTPLRYLVDLHSIMEKRMDFIEKPDDNEIEIIRIIEEMITL